MKTKNNLVAKHMEHFNKPKTFVDRKKAIKSGYFKHKACQIAPSSFLGFLFLQSLQTV